MKKLFSRAAARTAAAALACALLAGFLSACWDSDELDSLLIATGICLDTSETEGAVSVSVQVGNINRNIGGQGGLPSDEVFKMLDASDRSMLSALYQIRRKNSRELFLHHVQVIVVGMDLAKQGISEQLDFLVRDREMRMETWLVLADGKASELVSKEYISGQLPTITLSNMIHNMTRVSSHLGVNILDFVSKHISDSHCPVMPLIEMGMNADQPTLNFAGLGVFIDGKLAGTMNMDETEGWLWAMCGLNDGTLSVNLEQGSASLKVLMEIGSPKSELKEDGNVSVKIEVKTHLVIGQMSGFEGLEPTEIGKLIEKGAAAEIERKILVAFKKSQELGADILGIGQGIYEKHPKKWEKIKDGWTETFRRITPECDIEIIIKSTGKTGGIIKDDPPE